MPKRPAGLQFWTVLSALAKSAAMASKSNHWTSLDDDSTENSGGVFFLGGRSIESNHGWLSGRKISLLFNLFWGDISNPRVCRIHFKTKGSQRDSSNFARLLANVSLRVRNALPRPHWWDIWRTKTKICCFTSNLFYTHYCLSVLWNRTWKLKTTTGVQSSEIQRCIQFPTSMKQSCPSLATERAPWAGKSKGGD